MSLRVSLLVALVSVVWTGCIQDVTSPVSSPIPAGCDVGRLTAADKVATCLSLLKIITAADRDSALKVFDQATQLRDNIRADTSATSFAKAADLTRALARVGDFYSRRLFSDSARFHRMVDHVVATTEYVRGAMLNVGGHAFPQATPYLAWKVYPNLGIFFQPVETAQQVAFLLPRSTAPTDSLIQIAEHLYQYALWQTRGSVQYPVWEYNFPWNAAGVQLTAPWLSGLAQASIMMVFAECWRRTNDSTWLRRAYEVFRSMYIPWDQGGVLLPDTTHGYWWEEYHPVVQVWNGGAKALLAVGFLYSVTNDPEVKRVYDRGIEAIKYYTPFYDTGSWTLYSRTQGLNIVYYHNLCVQLLDALYQQSGDPWFKSVADRWRAYTPPPGIQ